jgi:hypothetical protein
MVAYKPALYFSGGEMKAPAFQFYPSDWSRDLEEHPLEIEGAWIRICCKLWWSETRGKLTRKNEQWAKILRVYPQDAERILQYINSEKIGDVFNDSNGNLTVISRRMLRDEKDRENNCIRQKRFYEKKKHNASITATSQDSSSSSSSSTTNNNPPTPRKRGIVYADDFLAFWASYPKKVGKDAAWRRWKQLNGTRPAIADLVSAIRKQAQSDQWQKENGQYIPNPATWLHEGRWADEINAQESQIDAWARKKKAEMEAQSGAV